jgi:hypothetical protein
MANSLDVINRGNRPTFVTYNRQEVIDIKIDTLYAGNFVKDWHVTEEVALTTDTSNLLLWILTI